MKRSSFAPRKKPMSRGSWKSSLSAKTIERRTAMKSRAKRPTVAEGSKYLEACRGERCYLKVVCGGYASPDIVVPAHRNEGKGIGMKVENFLTIPACHWCHMEYDQGKRFTREQKRELWNLAYAEWEPIRARKMGIEVREAA